MKRAGGFTFLELMVVVGIIVLLASILLPILSHVRRQSNITLQKLDFQTISSALEAYHQDFGDYPRNSALTSWAADNGTTQVEAPPFLSLATALIGPGPATWQNQGSLGLTAGDGANGGGFRAQATTSPPYGLAAPVSTGSNTVQVSDVPAAWKAMTLAQLIDTYSLTNVMLSSGTDHQEIIGLAPPSAALNPTGPYTLQMSYAAAFNHPQNPPPAGEGFAVFATAKGKIWPSYLPPDKFKVVFVQVPTALALPTESSPQGQPVILDRWNGVVEYFPRYGPNTNRIYTANGFANSSFPVPPVLPLAGPLYGYSSPVTVYTEVTPPLSVPAVPHGYNSIYDQRDGAPLLSSGGAYITSFAATQTMDIPAKPLNLGLAVQWMLGDDNLNNLIDPSSGGIPGERLRYDGNYVLISAGPDGPDRVADTATLPTYGGFLNIPAMTLQDPVSISKAMAASGNIYNFDR